MEAVIMGTAEVVRRCTCGTRLARDNRGDRCSACVRAGRRHPAQPPEVPAEFWDHPDLRAALAARDFGAVIRAYRTHPYHGQPIRQKTAATWINLSSSRLSRIENGEQVNDLTRLTHWAHAFGIPPHLLWFRMPAGGELVTPPSEDRLPGSSQQLPQPSQGGLLLPVLVDGYSVLVPVDAASIAQSGLGFLQRGRAVGCAAPTGSAATATERDAMPISRRSLFTRGVAAAALPALGLGEVEHVAKALADSRRYLDGTVIEYFYRQFEIAKADDGRLGPRKTLPLVRGILGAIEQSASDARTDVRRELLAVGARGAEFAGWLYRDVHDQATATYWHDRAMEWAQEAGDFPMQGYVLLKRAQMAYDNRDAVRVLTLAQAAQDGPWRLPPKVRAEVTQQEARGLAMLGEPMAAVEAKLEEAQRHFASHTDDDGSRLGTHYSASSLTLQTASCYIEAGKPQQAAALYEDVLQTSTLSQRDQGYFLARRASALALSGEPDDAAAVGLRSIHLADITSSTRTRRELGRAVSTLRPWSTRPKPRELREALATS
ncbi:helix-turn-helix transcriptional regulator [Saccharothrix sp. NPDC042600]|uniref:helix-turn-helix domain-containing protein n=1 Tax=Saccharothrix TaxID=2071 RepID=UPI0034116CDE